MARYDFGLSEEEFLDITPKMFYALGKRRNIRLTYERFANAQTAAAVYNTARTKDDQPMVEAFDFVATDEQAEKKEQLRKFKQHVQKTIGGLPFATPKEVLMEKRLKVIADLRASGCKEPEQLFDSIWPHLKPKEDTCQK